MTSCLYSPRCRESTYSRKLASTKNILGNWACGIQGSHKLVSGSTVCITLALYRLADLGLGPYLLVPGVLSCTVNTTKTSHPMNGTSETRTHQPLRSVS